MRFEVIKTQTLTAATKRRDSNESYGGRREYGSCLIPQSER